MLCDCMMGPNFPDPKCVRCHGTGTPVQGYSLVMLALDGRSWPKGWIPISPLLTHEPSDVIRFPDEDSAFRTAMEHKNWLTPFGHPPVNCVVNVYPKEPKGTTNAFDPLHSI